jgi:pimeloyl-ACP methyl ester carboxylesterase
VLLHGLLGSARNLSTFARLLSAASPDLTVVAFDLPGHGNSPPLPPAADSDVLAHEVLTSADALGLAPPWRLAGHSLGGRVALRAAQRQPTAIASVTLLDIPPGPLAAGGEVARVLDVLLGMPDIVASRADMRARLVGDGLSPALAEWLLLNLESHDGGYRWKIDRRALAALHTRIAAEDLWPAVEGVRDYAVRCVRGGASGYVGDADGRRLQAAGCPVVTIDGAGHFLHAERPEAAADAVLAFLA